MTKYEAIHIVRDIRSGSATNERITPLLEKLSAAFPNALFIDLLYHQKIKLTPEQIVEEAMRREAVEAAKMLISPKLNPMTKEEALQVVKQICNETHSRATVTPLFERLSGAFPHANFKDLICHQDVELTPEDIVREAMRREAEYSRKAGNTNG